jgi:hypothetical protein
MSDTRKPTHLELRKAAESYAQQMVAQGKQDGIEGFTVLVVLARKGVPPQYCTNIVRPQVPSFLEELAQEVRTENLVILPGGPRS